MQHMNTFGSENIVHVSGEIFYVVATVNFPPIMEASIPFKTS